jgi:diamine N-acetyltransferase
MQNHDSLHIRVGVESDAAELARFAARCFEEAFGAHNRPEHMQAHLSDVFGLAQQTRELRNPDMTTLLAFQSETLIAFAQVQRGKPPPCVTVDHAIELHRFYVDRSAHGLGVAQQLMQEVHHAALKVGGKHLWLSVWERNPRAIAFYKKVGFTDCGSTVFHLGPDAQADRVYIAALE